jgi:hypothetical protein
MTQKAPGIGIARLCELIGPEPQQLHLDALVVAHRVVVGDLNQRLQEIGVGHRLSASPGVVRKNASESA